MALTNVDIVAGLFIIDASLLLTTCLSENSGEIKNIIDDAEQTDLKIVLTCILEFEFINTSTNITNTNMRKTIRFTFC
ncbi:hypothetical protein AYI70_g11099 [Smittium culicis]|uniref:PIN domain-containing protein n=1 Tax=Smittium culicis TaxID=133412 RepID=A0A1R1X3D6_9FUNG|nr:hypothetical protein AYI70_g11399 [Smittium culicis]OMJ09145.1 hypothetical protein AYI70_g11099 [Smittium culicis]